MTEYRFAVNVTPRDGILDPQGRAVEQSLPHLGLSGIHGVRVGRRVELSVRANALEAARATVEQLARDLLSNPLIEQFRVEELGATSSVTSNGERPASGEDTALPGRRHALTGEAGRADGGTRATPGDPPR